MPGICDCHTIEKIRFSKNRDFKDFSRCAYSARRIFSVSDSYDPMFEYAAQGRHYKKTKFLIFEIFNICCVGGFFLNILFLDL